MIVDPFAFGVVMVLTVGGIAMATWMVVASWQDRGKYHRRRECSEIRTSISGRCVALEDK